ncbi:4,5-DOPA-extradiol-dioxygenase [Echinicola rosea]|uniref:Dioxygenase n=1 Tax=Echinicola rosea TaxID=1807691 RepID=A0ABQ1V995_9BACT|nr:4,5-DOPA dioxygenase extradiol [Echinicola rosea]GGF45666.1 dioxygenase [Echinicola rosea]
MNNLGDFKRFTSSLKEGGVQMPVLFVGHGSPMNGIEDNVFSGYWKKLGQEIPHPTAVLVISAHWLSRGTRITAMDFPRTIHDFGGFPRELFEVQYPAPGHPDLAKAIEEGVSTVNVALDHEWGLDHGAWTVVRHMYPDAAIPVLQLSIDYGQSPQYHYELAKELHDLRQKGVLIIGSGNMVHNLRMVAWDKLSEPEYGYDWAIEMNEQFKQLIINGNHRALMDYHKFGKAARLAIPTPDHYLPLLYTLGLKSEAEPTTFFNDKVVGGSLTMTSAVFGEYK